jgi:hypothetical protein
MNFNTTPTRPVQERDRLAIADLLAAASAKLAEASRRMAQTERAVYWPVPVTTALGTMEVDDIIEATRDMAEAWLDGTEQEGLPF